MTKLIVNADDFGLTPGVNRAIAELQQAGALTSATLMANGAAFDDAVQRARKADALRIGCHVVLVDGAPLAPPATIRSLADPDGRLRDSLFRFALDLQRGHILEDDIEREATCQITYLQQAGVAVSHVDTHKHTHLFPRVARPLMRAAASCGVRAIRNPFEPLWSVRRIRGAWLRKVEVIALRAFRKGFQTLCREFALETTDGCIGVAATGRLDAAAVHALLRDIPEGCYELVCHPGYNDSALDLVRTRLRQAREIERAALLAQVPAARSEEGIELLSFADLTDTPRRIHT